MFIIIFLIAIFMVVGSWAAVIITFISLWKTHEKAGLPGWSGIVPYYNYFVRAEKLGLKDSFWKSMKLLGINIGVSIIGSLLATVITILTAIGTLGTIGIIGAENVDAAAGLFVTSGAMILVATIGGLVTIVCCILMVMSLIEIIKIDIKFAEGFGKGKAFVAGMFLLPFVFYPMLAWGSAIWQKQTDCIDTEANIET